MRRRGFSLVELLCVMALLAVVGLILALLLRQTLDAERTQSDSFNQMLLRNALADQFRGDVSRADKQLDTWREFGAGADTLILHMPDDKHIVYRWQDGELERMTFTGDKETKRTVPLGHKELKVEIDASQRLARLRLRALHLGKVLPGRTTEITAALGGDAR
jgi:prepilin-type N-terminal cleavage/methylation domain-containing protein